MRRVAALLLIGAMGAFASTACSVSVRGTASPPTAASTSSAPSSPAPSSSRGPIPGGAEAPCPVDDCPSSESGSPPVPAGLVCAPLASAMAAFDSAAGKAFPDGRVPTNGTAATWSSLSALVTDVVGACGYQVMVDVAAQYPEPLYSWLTAAAVVALGPLAELPGGLLCRDLAAQGYGVQDAVDYWFLWGRPDIMDADRNGIPCETVFADVPAHMPSG
jgi:hypothetical protein